jgi:hypothetical protein
MEHQHDERPFRETLEATQDGRIISLLVGSAQRITAVAADCGVRSRCRNRRIVVY